ncbi:NAD(P)H-dependent oxidoreductase [Vibrio breoganii]|uniref:FMN-dependent NADH-azoreductase n=1 Tax=Vibrio breoganii TaxID=553239 RepID=UPI000C84FE70|nr:NAD(P)H-dependent oxidoreductase [Vibrio breoganii]PMO27887.1 FMN-dependent NADH-azoreductase [Vibrio breoganii]
MHNILLVKSSLNGEQGNSTVLANEFLEVVKTKSSVKVTERDLGDNKLGHLASAEMSSWMIPENERTQEQKELASISDQLIVQLQASDTLVVAMPMYNFGVPSTFKAWVDRIARAGITFKYTDQGPVGLLEGKKVIVIAARGGLYAGTPKDSQTQYLKDLFAFIGITDVEFIYAEGLNMPVKEDNLVKAREVMISMAEKISA